MTTLIDSSRYPHFARIMDAVLACWPEHLKYMTTNLAERDASLLDHSERLAEMVVALSESGDRGLDVLAADYRFLCEKIVLPEEFHFRRHNEYRLKTFAEALETVYSDTEFMSRYMNGLLLTHVMWINHCQAMRHFAETFLSGLPEGANHLEIGPGHGLLLCMAADAPAIGNMTAWDVSEASLEQSRHSLDALGAGKSVDFVKRDIFALEDGDEDSFDSIVFSEVLEHMEEPLEALKVLHRVCKPGGKVWIHVPANSPAPDHLYLVSDPAEATDIVQQAGFEIVETADYPMSGTTLEKAIRNKLTVSCVVVGRKPA